MSVRNILFSIFLVFFGSSAQAATIKNGTYAVEIEMVGLEWSCTQSYCLEYEPDFTSFKGLEVGNVVRGWMTLSSSSKSVFMSLSWLGQTALSENFFPGADSVYWNGYSRDLEFEKESKFIKGQFRQYSDAPWGYMLTLDLRQVVVPLPASAALLPMGMGALACLRRRRKRIIPPSAAGSCRPGR